MIANCPSTHSMSVPLSTRTTTSWTLINVESGVHPMRRDCCVLETVRNDPRVLKLS